jgi:1-deoxy-D-xylulose-5-phosphate reductoisomerase
LAAYRVEALTALSNVELLADQARRLGARLAVIGDERRYGALKSALDGTSVRVAAGVEGLVEAASQPSDWVMAGIVGAAGLRPTMAAVKRGAVVALANKECLVCAGEFVMREVKRSNATLLPVDSEHNAIFQVFDFDRPERVEKIILTASGGPFREFDREAMRRVTPREAVAHPNWDMGAKISVDSATMMNKGLELIEAHHLFPVTESQIDILVHPQSVVHSMVAYCDGSVLAQLGSPDMRTPIAYSLAWPDRLAAPVPRLDLAEIGKLTFEQPDIDRFPAIGLARSVLESGGGAATAMNAANEIAVEGFLAQRIGFLDIVSVVEETLNRIGTVQIASLDEVDEIDGEARAIAGALIAGPGKTSRDPDRRHHSKTD